MGTRTSVSQSSCHLPSEAFGDSPWKGYRRGERPSLDFTGTPEAQDTAILEMLHYLWEPNSPALKATGHRCLPFQSPQTLRVPTVCLGIKFPPSVEPVALSQGRQL